jgi:hypothetical protein
MQDFAGALMFSRNVIDADGRSWACRQDGTDSIEGTKQGQDVSILCTTASVAVPVRLTVGWQWDRMADNGLARLITAVSPAPRKKM